MSGKMSVNANRLITDFITGRIWPVKCQLTLADIVRTALRVSHETVNGLFLRI